MTSFTHELPESLRDESLNKGNFPVDKNVIAHFPPGSQVLSANRYGSSAWTVIRVIITELPDGAPKKYFLKSATGKGGYDMMEGEFWAMTELHKTIPANTPRPIARGKFEKETPPTYFLLCEFMEMSDELPDPERLCVLVNELHSNSVSPTGKFGFHVRTCNGRTPQATEWDDSWTSFFTELLEHAVAEDAKVNGAWTDMERVGQRLLEVVIPRLIGALEVCTP